MDRTELQAWDWVTKITEKLTFIRLNALDHRDITEEDYEILKVLYRQWWEGVHPLYQTEISDNDEKTVQQSALSDTPSDYHDGTKVVRYESET